MKRGDRVTTWTGRSGRITAILPDGRVRVQITCYLRDNTNKPRATPIEAIYRRRDVTRIPGG